MSATIAPFRERYRRALADSRLRANLLNFQRAWSTSRAAAFDRLARDLQQTGTAPAASGTSAFEANREQLVSLKDQVLHDPATIRDRFIAAATQAGTVVHEAPTAADARDIILRLLRDRGARLLAKGKSMVAEEVFLNHHLEAAGLRVVETDLGEWIVQLARETPSHMVLPAIHKGRQQVAALFEQETHREVPRDDVAAQVRLAREALRQVFLEADAGLIGANALIAETGSVMLITNEGNGDLVATLPRLLIVIAGWEKLVPTLASAATQLRLLARSATNQDITTYTSFITGVEPGREVHLVLVDNGRTQMWQDARFRDALRCIRCAACADVCPPYQVVGGHVFGYVYSGAIGLVNTPFHHGLEAAAGPQSLCVSCNACATVCPAGIPLPRQILDVRARVVAARGLPWPQRAAFFIWGHARLFDLAMRAGSVLQQAFVRRGRHADGSAAPERFLRLPRPPALAWRSVPALADHPARDTLLGRTFEPDLTGPWSGSAVRGCTVAYFLQCLSDRFSPEQPAAAVRVLRACGARVVVPRDQHCCGLPHLDAGDQRAARRLAKATIAALELVPADYVVTAAASCAIAVAHDYAHLLHDEPEWHARATRLAARTYDLLSFLDRVARVTDLPPLPARPPAQLSSPHSLVVTPSVGTLAARSPGEGHPQQSSAAAPIACHRFCQSTNVARLGDTAIRLLRHAGLDLIDLPEAEVCCGFGGSTSLKHPEVARGIVERKLANVRATGAAALVTDNPGCVLHLRGAADAAGDSFQVKHVVELLAAQLDQAPQP